MRADDRLAGSELDEFLALTMIRPVRPGVGIEDPVFVDAVLLIRGELRTDIAIRRPRGEGFHHQSRGKGRMAFRQSPNLLEREVGEVRQEHIAGAEADGDNFAMHLAKLFPFDVEMHQTEQEIEQARVPEVNWRVHEPFPVDQIRVNARFEPLEKIRGGPEFPLHFVAHGHQGRHGGKLVQRRGGRKNDVRRWAGQIFRLDGQQGSRRMWRFAAALPDRSCANKENHAPSQNRLGLVGIPDVPIRARRVNNPNTDWLRDAKYGVFMHFLPANAKGLELVERFDVEALSRQLERAGAKYLVITLGQNSGYFNSPNAVYDRYTGYGPGERCSLRDLPLDLSRALQAKGIRLMLYLPCQVPNEDGRAQKAFGLPEGKQDQPIDVAFARKWAEVIQEWSVRYGDKVAGWWFDGGYEHIHFNQVIAAIYAQAVKSGNPKAIVTFNPGVRVVHYTEAEDYTAGELNEAFDQIPSSRWLQGSQWHALTFMGTQWGRRDTRYSAERWAEWVKTVTDRGGVVTLDLGPNYDPSAGPVGSLDGGQLGQVEVVKAALGSASGP